MRYIDNTISNDPAFNLAAEAYVFNTMGLTEECFMLWQNHNAIIIGRNQNTLEEINRDYTKEKDIKVVRRLSGGGAVYHDMGNLNFTFIRNNEDASDFSFFAQPIIRALDHFGVRAEFTGRNDITVDGKKFSGNSQYRKKGRVLHHGTLLFDSNLEVLGQALKAKPEKMITKGVTSVKSRVTNLAPYLKGCSGVNDFKTSLVEAMDFDEVLEPYVFTEKDILAIEKLRDEQYDTWNWNYGESPAYNIRKDKRFPFGQVTLLVSIKDNKIAAIYVQGDFFSDRDIGELLQSLKDCPFDEKALAERLTLTNVASYILGMTNRDFIDLLLS